MRLRYPLFACLVLAACGGGGGGVVDPTGPQALLDKLNYSLTLAGQLDGLDQTQASPGGGATFDGVMILATNPNGVGDTLTGDVNLTANFDAPSLSGTADDFYYYHTSGATTTVGTTAAGTLNLNAPALAFGANTFETNVTGSLTFLGGQHAANGSMTTAFAGNPIIGPTNVQMVAGATDGTTGPISFGAGGNFEAVFIAERP